MPIDRATERKAPEHNEQGYMNKFQIANFKAFSDMQTIPLKPITIIFGPNSSGKSSTE